MTDNDYEPFVALISDALAFWRRDVSEFSLRVWWEAMKPFDLAAVTQGLSRYAMSPEASSFGPEPKHIVTMLSGRSVDSAAVAWAAVEKAVRMVGPYRSVVFDDPLIHACIDQLGGWVALCGVSGEEWPFKGNAFRTAYAGYRMRSDVPPYPTTLIGLAEAQNARNGWPVEGPTMIGDQSKCRAVMAGGGADPVLRIVHGAPRLAVA